MLISINQSDGTPMYFQLVRQVKHLIATGRMGPGDELPSVRVLAQQLASRNITVNAIAPGPFESKMMAETLRNFRDAIVGSCPLGRIGEPEDMAGATIFLASRAGAYLTGTVIPVDGGISTRG